MKQVVYPAIIYKNDIDDGVTITIPDLNIITEGDTVEKAFEYAKGYLETFLEVSQYLDAELPEPSDFRLLYKQHKKEIVILVDKEIE